MAHFKIQTNNNDAQKAKVLLEEDNYIAEVIAVSDIFQGRAYQSENTVDKLAITFKINLPEEEVKRLKLLIQPELVMYATTKVTRKFKTSDGKEVSNSKLFDTLCRANQDETGDSTYNELMQQDGLILHLPEEKQDAAFVQFIKDKILNKECKVSVTTSKRGTDGAYSKVVRIIKFL